MSKKKGKRATPVAPKKKEDGKILVMTGKEKAKKMMPHYEVTFKTGKYLTEKDRPRKKFKAKDIDLSQD